MVRLMVQQATHPTSFPPQSLDLLLLLLLGLRPRAACLDPHCHLYLWGGNWTQAARKESRGKVKRPKPLTTLTLISPTKGGWGIVGKPAGCTLKSTSQ